MENCKQNFVASNYDVDHAITATNEIKAVNIFAKSVVELNRAIDALIKHKELLYRKQQLFVNVVIDD